MRSENSPPVQGARSFIEARRRDQIVACAIDTIAELGYGQASLAQIAKRAGISKGVISYHFSGKEDLIKDVFAAVIAAGITYMRPRILAESTGSGALRAYIESNLAFMREHRKHVMTVREILLNARRDDGSLLVDATAVHSAEAALERLLRRFQAEGEFRAFDPQVMAATIRAAIDAAPRRLATDPAFDLDSYGRELVTLFDLATRAEGKPLSRSNR